MSKIDSVITQIEELGEKAKIVSGVTKNLKSIFSEITESEKQEIIKKLTIRRIKHTEKQKANLININYFIAGIKCKTEDEIEKIFKEKKIETKKEKKQEKEERKREKKEEDEQKKREKEELKKKEKEENEIQKKEKEERKKKEKEDEEKKKREKEELKKKEKETKTPEEKTKEPEETPDEDKIKQSEEKIKKIQEEQEKTEEDMKKELKTISIEEFLKLTYITNNVFDFIQEERKDIFNTYYEVMEGNGKVLLGEDSEPIYDTKS